MMFFSRQQHGTNLYKNNRKGSLGGKHSVASDTSSRLRQSRRLSHGGGCVYSYHNGEENRASIRSSNSVGSNNSSRSSIVGVHRDRGSISQRERRITGLKSLQNWRKGVVGRIKVSIQVKFLSEDEEMQYTANSVYSNLSLSKHSIHDGSKNSIQTDDAGGKSPLVSPHATLAAGQLSSLTSPGDTSQIAFAHNENDNKNEESWPNDIVNDGKNNETFLPVTKFPIPPIIEDALDTEEALNRGLVRRADEDEVTDNATRLSNSLNYGGESHNDLEQSTARLESSFGVNRSSWHFDVRRDESGRRLRPRQRMVVCLEIEKCEELRMSTPGVSMGVLSSAKMYKGQARSDSSMNPFVVIRLNNNEIGRTPALKNTNRPTWFDEMYKFPMCTHCTKLNFEVWNIKSYSREVGECIGVATIDTRDLADIHRDENDFLEYDLELYKLRDDDEDITSRHGQCSCPDLDGQSSPENKLTQQKKPIHHVMKNEFHRGIFKSVKNLAMKISKSTHGQRLPLDNENSERFKIENPHPFRRQDIREENKKEDRGSILTSSTSKALYMILGYMILGVLGFSFVFEDQNWDDALYLSVVTFTTVGYG